VKGLSASVLGVWFCLQVSAEERKMAAAAIGGKTAQLSVAFGKRAPVYDPAWNVKVSMSRMA